ncbi:hypothetical protein H5300_16165 [Vibrio sp. SG41-7]|uniref:hypothetical protein n=1 Tax=Vibrio sp. SG41-7 TaxID=2760973 RepID=UPI001603D8CF|nr:hypothetical protein [Vibrio sp. SG41-7]MBB1464849.1 hypothetical protein [Vibrio sp. SG41-7]
MSINTIAICIVSYNREFNEVVPLDFIKDYEVANGNSLSIEVYDNSVDGWEFIPEYVEYYSHTGKNRSLSKIYNEFCMRHKSSAQYLLFLDHDTRLTYDYFNELLQCCSEGVSQILVPKIDYNNKLVSPYFEISYKRFPYVSSLDKFLGRRLRAIGSGICIRNDVASRLPFDEKLNLYGIDTKFFIDYLIDNSRKNIFIMNSTLEHDLSLSINNDNIVVLENRVRKYLDDFEVIFGSSFYVKSYKFFLGVFYKLWFAIRR